jgi:hypothetical protein
MRPHTGRYHTGIETSPMPTHDQTASCGEAERIREHVRKRLQKLCKHQQAKRRIEPIALSEEGHQD